MLFMGIDIGTQGVRVIVTDEKGKSAAGASVPFDTLNTAQIPGFYEQRPETWWACTSQAILKCISELKHNNINPSRICSIAIDGTSGTILPVDSNYHPLMDGIMYNDTRSKDESEIASKASSACGVGASVKFNASFALPKILWIKNKHPEIYEKTLIFIHQADFIVGKLSGEYGVTDYSNALKTGYDLVRNEWPEYLGKLGLDAKKLPRVITPGNVIGRVSENISKQLGLSNKTYITAGATDGYASALAAGAVHTGSWATILGTTLVLKGVSEKLINDPTGSSYSHKLPLGSWMVGGASNVGGRCLNNRFDKTEFAELDKAVDLLTPTGVLVYPLTGTGERYPFISSSAREFIIGDVSDRRVLYTALMEGVGYVERMAYELNQKMGYSIADMIYTSGGACRSAEWLKIRSSIMNKPMKVPVVVDAAMGSAMLAASQRYFSCLEEAADSMINFAATVEPVTQNISKYNELYYKFLDECRKQFEMEF